MGYISEAEDIEPMLHMTPVSNNASWSKHVHSTTVPFQLAAANEALKDGESSSSAGGGIHINVQDSQKEGEHQAQEPHKEKGGGGIGGLLGGILKVPEEILGGVASLL